MPDRAVSLLARELLVHVANEVGFPAPASGQGLMAWADDSLDVALVRGTLPWAAAHAHVLDALEAAMLASEGGVRAALTCARDLACAGSRRRDPCSCLPNARGLRAATTGGQGVCVKCGGRPV